MGQNFPLKRILDFKDTNFVLFLLSKLFKNVCPAEEEYEPWALLRNVCSEHSPGTADLLLSTNTQREAVEFFG